MAEVWTAQLRIADGSSSEDAPEIAYAERLDDRGQVARLYIVAEPERPGSEQFIEDLVTGLGEEFVSGTGSLTGLVQRAIRGRHDDLLDWNRESLPRDQASYGLSCLILREDGGYLAQQGPSLVLYRQGKRLLRRRPAAERSTRALGTAEAGAPEFSQIMLEAGDWALLISSNAGSVLGDEALASLRGLQAEDVLPALYPHVRHVERLSALVVAPEPLTTEFRPLAAAPAGEGSDGGEDPGAGATAEEQADEATEGEDAAGLPEAPIRDTSHELSEQEPPYAEEVEQAQEAEAALDVRTSIGGLWPPCDSGCSDADPASIRGRESSEAPNPKRCARRSRRSTRRPRAGKLVQRPALRRRLAPETRLAPEMRPARRTRGSCRWLVTSILSPGAVRKTRRASGARLKRALSTRIVPRTMTMAPMTMAPTTMIPKGVRPQPARGPRERPLPQALRRTRKRRVRRAQWSTASSRRPRPCRGWRQSSPR